MYLKPRKHLWWGKMVWNISVLILAVLCVLLEHAFVR